MSISPVRTELDRPTEGMVSGRGAVETMVNTASTNIQMP